MEKGSDKNMKAQQRQRLSPAQTNASYSCRLVAKELESIFAEENVGAIMDKNWIMSWQCALEPI